MSPNVEGKVKTPKTPLELLRPGLFLPGEIRHKALDQAALTECMQLAQQVFTYQVEKVLLHPMQMIETTWSRQEFAGAIAKLHRLMEAVLDAVQVTPPSPERVQRIRQLKNTLKYADDSLEATIMLASSEPHVLLGAFSAEQAQYVLFLMQSLAGNQKKYVSMLESLTQFVGGMNSQKFSSSQLASQ